MKTKTYRLTNAHVREEWNEGEDGHWIALRSGWKWAGDPVGAVHQIHEDTRTKAWHERVMQCDCSDCRFQPQPGITPPSLPVQPGTPR